MSWKVEYLPEAEKDLKGLDGSQRNLVLKAIKKVQQNTELYTAQQKERGGHFPLTFSRFFLDSTSVCTFRPHSSISWGRIW